MQPTGVLSPLELWAAHVHELYVVLQHAGFTANEALVLLSGVLTNKEERHGTES